MAYNKATSLAAKGIAAFMQPYAKEFKRLEKAKHKAAEWNDRAILKSQLARANEPAQNAKMAQAASATATSALDNASVEIMKGYHRQFEGLEFFSRQEMNAAISNEEWGTGKKIEELGKSLAEEKHNAAGRIKLPVSVIGLLMLAFCAVTGYLTTAGLIVLAGAGLVMGIAERVVKSIFSKRETALAIWEKAAARVRGLVQDGNGDDEMNMLIEENALTKNISMN